MKEMTTYNTGKPIGSSSAKDLFDNAENLDRAVNDRTSRTWTDRLGRERVTLHAVETAVPDAINARNGAEAARDVAVLAKDAAFVNADVYPDVAAGLAAVAVGEQFQVLADGGLEYRRYRKDSAAVATEVGEGFPSPLYLRAVADEARRKHGFDSPEQGVDTDSGVEAGDLYWVRESLASESSELYRNVDGRPVDTGIRQSLNLSSAPSAITLMGDEPEGLAIDITAAVFDAEVKIVDLENPSNNHLGSLGESELGNRSMARMIQRGDGSVSWSDHNLLRFSEDFQSWSKEMVSVGDRQRGYSPIEVTSSGSAYVFLTATNTKASAYHTVDLLISPGGSDYAYVAQDNSGDVRYAYFNISTAVVGTLSPGVTARFLSSYADGSPLPRGHRRVSITIKNSEISSFQVRVGPCVEDGSPTASVGQSLNLQSVSLMFGANTAQRYVRTTGTARYMPPYDWSRGVRTLLIENFTVNFIGLWSDDLTNPAWVKTGGSVDLSATGPHGEPCSTFTATESGATVIQPAADTSISRTFHAYLRRRNGSGSVEITADNGGTWHDVTDKLGTDLFSKVYAHREAEGAGFGIRLSAAGDSIEVALANYTTAQMVTSSVPTYGSTRTLPADPFIAPLPAYDADIGLSGYFDYYKSEDAAASSTVYAGFTGPGSGRAWITTAGQGIGREDRDDSGQTTSALVGNYVYGDRIEAAILARNNEMATSLRGQGEVYRNVPAPEGLSSATLSGTGSQIFLRRLLVSPRYLGADGLTNWRYSGEGADARYIADAKIARHGEIPGTTLCREPSVAILSENSESAHLATVFMNKNEFSAEAHSEMPARLMRKDFSFNKVTGELTPLSDPFVIQQQENWDEGLGHLQGGKLIKVRVNEKRGRLLFLWTQLDTENGLVSPDWRPIYCKHSDDNGVTWSDPVMIHDPGEGNFAVLTGGGYVELTDGPNKGRIVVPFSRPVRCLYSDDGGDTWSVGQPGLNTGTDTEPSISLRPDGSTIVMTLRKQTGPVWRSYCYSYDGGETLTEVLPISGYEGTGVFLSTVQADTEGGNGRRGKLLLCGARSGSPTRSRLAVEELIGENLTPSGEQFLPLDPGRVTGYTSAVHLSGGFVAIAYESAPTSSFNSYCDVRLMIVSDKV